MALDLITLQDYFDRASLAFKRFQFGNKAQLAFLEDLYTLINDGIPANRAIEMMAQATRGLTQQVALALSQSIAEGRPLAEGMKGWFSPSVTEIIRVGESGGALAQTIKSAISALSQRGVAIGSLIAAISYPLLVLIIGCLVTVYMNHKVLPQFAMIKPESQWPSSGQHLVALAEFIEHWWWTVVIGVIAVILIVRWLMMHYVGSLRPALDQFPPFSFYKRLIAAQFLETLGLLVSNGLVFRSAIKVMQYQANPYLGYHLEQMEHILSMGKTNIAEVLDTGLINEHDLMRLRVMAEVKGFEHGLIRMGVRGAADTTATMKFIARITGGALLVVGALIILIIVQGLYMTGMSLSS